MIQKNVLIPLPNITVHYYNCKEVCNIVYSAFKIIASLAVIYKHWQYLVSRFLCEQ